MKACLVAYLTVASAFAAAGPTPPKVKLDEPIDLPHVGLRIAMPVSLGRELVENQAGVWLSWQSAKEPRDFTILYAFALYGDSAGPSLKDWARQIAAASGGEDRKLKKETLASGEVRFGERTAFQIVTRMSKGDEVRIEACTVFTARLPKHKLTFYYTLGVDVLGADPAPAVARSRAICESVKLIPLASPADGPVGALVVPLEFAEEGFRIKLPAGWYMREPTKGETGNFLLRAGAMDHIRRRPLPYLSVSVAKADLTDGLDVTSKAHVRRVVGHMKMRHWYAKWSLVSTGETVLGGRKALQIVARSELHRLNYCQVQRKAVHDKKLYSIGIMYPGHDPKRALAAMDKLAGAFEFVTAPASQPTTTQAVGK